MSRFHLHDEQSAPPEARPAMAQAGQAFGFVPNLIRGMAESPSLAEGYLTLSGIFARCGLCPQEQQIVLLAVSRNNGCGYCVAAHSMAAGMCQVPAEAVAAARDGRPIPDARLEALRVFADKMVEQRGWFDEQDIQAFLDAGYEARHVADVILATGMKTLSNYFNHIAGTPLDTAMQDYAWAPVAAGK